MNSNLLIINFNHSLIKYLDVFSIDTPKGRELVNYCHWNHPHIGYPVDSSNNHGIRNSIQEFVNIWTPFIPPDSVAVDIGGGGDSVISLGLLTDKVLAFEPGPPYQILQANVAFNPHLNIEIFNHAITPEDGEFEFLYAQQGQNRGMNTPELHIGNFNEKVKVIGKRLKNVISDDNYLKIKFIKIDTEGSDIAILNSVSELIWDNRPVIFTEWWCMTEEKINKFLEDFDYTPFDGNLKKIAVIPPNRCQDLLLVPSENINKYPQLSF